MDKDRQLRRYRRKDYREVVEFPVEIVGRDGLARHYDFDASIRLYQRRIRFAAARFGDEDVIAAEQGHCRARVEQLRRSFFEQHGWITPAGERGFEQAHPARAGELAAFLLRILGEHGRPEVRFVHLGSDGDADLWHLTLGGEGLGLLLYAFAQDDIERTSFPQRLAALEHAPQGAGDTERLVGHHRVADCAFLLTGRAADVHTLVASVRELPDGDDAAGGTSGIAALVRRGDLPGAFFRARGAVQAHPWDREACAAAAALAILLHRPGDAEDLAFVGTRYVPDDALLHHYLGLARLQQGRPGEAVEAFEAALARDPSLAVARALHLVALLRAGRPLAALRALRVADPAPPRRADADAIAWRGLARQVRRAVLVAAGFAGVCAAAGIAVGWLGGAAVVPALAGAGVATASLVAAARGLAATVHRVSEDDVDRALQRIGRRTTGARPG